MANDPRHTKQWLHLAKRMVQPGSICWLCGTPIRFDVPPRSRWSGSLDHVIPIAIRPDLAWSPANLMPAHVGCNSRKRDKVVGVLRRKDDW